MAAENTNSQDDAGSQVYHELHAVVSRYGKESDVTVFQIVGALEAVKFDLMDELRNHGRKEKE